MKRFLALICLCGLAACAEAPSESDGDSSRPSSPVRYIAFRSKILEGADVSEDGITILGGRGGEHQVAVISRDEKLEALLRLLEALRTKTKYCSDLIDITPFVPTDLDGDRLSSFLAEFTDKEFCTPQQAEGFNVPEGFPKYQSIVRDQIERIDTEEIVSTIRMLTGICDDYGNRYCTKKGSEEARRSLADLANGHARARSVLNENVPTYSMSGALANPSILLTIPGEKALPGILLTAHFDTVLDSSQNTPGADDNASGTAAAVEVFRVLVTSGLKFNRPIYIALTNGEEDSLQGSKAMITFLEKRFGMHTSANPTMLAVMNLDMTGYQPAGSKPLYFVTNHTDRELTKFTGDVAQHYLGLKPDEIGLTKCTGCADCSDHATFYYQRFATVFPFETDYTAIGANRIHTKNDVKVDPASIRRFTELALAFVLELAEPS